METGVDQCLAFIQCNLQSPRTVKLAGNGKGRWRAVTISRQAGAGGHAVAERLTEILQSHNPKGVPWTVFDRNLVEKVLEEHELPTRLAQFMPEDRISEFQDTIEDLVGVHPSAWTLVHKSAETILHLVELGNVIIIGRGANVITRRLESVFHVRLVAPLDKRIEYIQKVRSVGKKAAVGFIEAEDRGRRRYLKKYFGQNIDDPLLYHLVINTELTGLDEGAHIIGKAIQFGN